MVTAADLKKKARDLPVRTGVRQFVQTVSSGNGRPRIVLDMAVVERLAKIQATAEEIAAVMGVNVKILRAQPNFEEIYYRGTRRGRKSLRRKIWRGAMGRSKAAKGNPSLQVWLSKQHLGMHEPGQKIELETTGEVEHQHIHTLQIEPDQFKAALAVLVEAGALRQLPEGVIIDVEAGS